MENLYLIRCNEYFKIGVANLPYPLEEMRRIYRDGGKP